MKTLKLRFFSISMKIIIIYTTIIVVFASAFFMTYYISKIEISDKLVKVNEEYFSNKISYIGSTFKDIKNNAYELRNYMGSNSAVINSDSLGKFNQINRLTRIVNYYNYLDDVFLYDTSTGYFISTQGSMDIDVYFRMSYFEDKLTGKWSDLSDSNEDIVINITKYPDDETANRKDYYKRLLYVDTDYLKNSKIIVGFIIDIEKIIRNENYENADINNFFVIKNDNGNSLQEFLYNNFNYSLKQNDLNNDNLTNILKIKDSILFYQVDKKFNLTYLNVVNMRKYYDRLGYYNVLPIIIISLFLLIVTVVSSSFLTKFYRNLKSIKSFIEGSFVKNILAKQPGISFMHDVKDFIGLSGIKHINVIMLSAAVKSIAIEKIETKEYDKIFNKFLVNNGIRFKSFDFIKLKRIYIIDAKSIKNYSTLIKTMQKFLNDNDNELISVNLFISGIYNDNEGIEKAVDEVFYISENVPAKVSNKVVLLEKDILEEYKYMPEEFKNMFRNSLACGDKQLALKLIKDIIDNNISNGTSINNFKSVIAKINTVILEVVIEEYGKYYDDSAKVINKINNLVDEIEAEYIYNFYEELMEGIDVIPLLNEYKGKSKLQQSFISYIEENYDKDIYLETMAEYFNISSKYASSKFKEITGENFTDYLKHYRINTAKEMLKSTQHKINEISEKVGYNNVNVFIRHFKSIEGITPKAFREIN